MKLDLHGLTLNEAIDEILWKVEESLYQGDHYLELVHGYHHGQVLKNHVRSRNFEREMLKNGFVFSQTNTQDDGITCFNVQESKNN